MNDPQVYLRKLSAFSRQLAREGLAVGPAETADAARVLILVGLEDRERVKTALCTVYAKSREEQLVFGKCFDGFFLSREAMEAQAKARLEERQALERRRREAEELLNLNGKPLDLTEQQRRAYASMPDEARQRLTGFLDKYRQTAERNPKLYGEFIHSVFTRAILEQQMLLEDAGLGGEAADPDIGLMYRDISQFKDTEIPRAVAILQTVARQVNASLSARRRAQAHTGKLDFRRTIRLGLETGGSFHRLRYRRKRGRKKHLVILCDVSGSMMQFSEFALRFIQSLNQASDNSRVFLFSETVVEADPFRLENMDLFRDYVRQSGVYGRGTDLGAALTHLCASRPPVLGQSTTLLILSDSKTIDQNRAVQALLEAQRQAGRVIWLNPIPQRKWQYLRSVQTMAAVCAMAPCATLQELTAALSGRPFGLL